MEDLNCLEVKTPEEIFFERESELELARALVQLQQIYRAAILLKHVGELSYAEISQTLDLEPSLVKNRLYQGRLMLGHRLGYSSRRAGSSPDDPAGYYNSQHTVDNS